jgi:alkylated DNA repair dioxygenase AlkB
MKTSPDVELWPDFVPDGGHVFERLVSDITWDESMRARKTASYGVPYNYSQMSYPAQDFLPDLEALLSPLESKIGWMPNNCLINYYPDGDSSMGFHFDAVEILQDGTGVAIVSLGSERTMTFKRRDTKSVVCEIQLPANSLFLMSAEVQNEWLHAILQAESVGPRMSLTFRRLK